MAGETKPKKSRRLTLKQEGFVRTLLETKNASEAIRQNYDVKDASPSTISQMGAENLNKPSIQEAIQDLKDQYVSDSYIVYAHQKEIFDKAKDHPKYWELANKIANKIQDRAGFAPTYKTENKSMHARFVITRGEDKKMIEDTSDDISPL